MLYLGPVLNWWLCLSGGIVLGVAALIEYFQRIGRRGSLSSYEFLCSAVLS